MKRRVPLIAALAIAVGLAGGCTASDGVEDSTPAVVPRETAPFYVAVGASESVGFGTDDPLREAWPQVFFRAALPRESVFVNLAVPGSTVSEAFIRQVPEARALRPSIVTVWLNVNDLAAGVPAHEYEQNLGDLVRALRVSGRRPRVLVANVPELDRLPDYVRCQDHPGVGCWFRGELAEPGALRAAVADYNAAIGRVTRREDAVLVDLRAAGLAARSAGTEATLVADDGFHPSPQGHRVVAAAFADALRRVEHPAHPG